MGVAGPAPQGVGRTPRTEEPQLPQAIEPMEAARGGSPFDSPDYIFEVKWDGVRALAFLERGSVRLQDRYLRDVTDVYPELAGLGRRIKGGAAVLDGEIVALDEQGRPDFARLSARLATRRERERGQPAAADPVVFHAFDILYAEGQNVMEVPLRRRKALLHRTTRPGGPLVVPASFGGEGLALFEAARQHGLEGIVAKQRNSGYLSGERSDAWLKLKVYEKEEFVVGGFTYGGATHAPSQRREPFASLLLGLYDDAGELHYVGEVSGGFTPASAQETQRMLDTLTSERCPFEQEPPCVRLVFWCRPELAVSVRFGEWGREDRLLFPVFDGARPDVPAASCRLEAVIA